MKIAYRFPLLACHRCRDTLPVEVDERGQLTPWGLRFLRGQGWQLVATVGVRCKRCCEDVAEGKG